MPEDVYRCCASILVFRDQKILLLHKPRTCDAWQLPQGGVEEGETIEQAALRELQEEAGIDAEVIGKSSMQYQYDFPESFRNVRPDNVCGQCVHFVFARANENQDVQVDNNEIDEYVWIDVSDLEKYIERDEYLAIVKQLVHEYLSP